MIRRLILVFITLPLAILLIALAVANRAMTPLHFDVFNPQNPALTVNAPMFIWIFAAVGFGVLAGGIGAWFAQGKHRKAKRQYKKEADSLRFQASEATGSAKADAGRSLVASH